MRSQPGGLGKLLVDRHIIATGSWPKSKCLGEKTQDRSKHLATMVNVHKQSMPACLVWLALSISSDGNIRNAEFKKLTKDEIQKRYGGD